MPSSLEEIAAMEAAAFASWPSIDGEEDLFGWRLRYGSGYTKRANSANSGAAAMALSDEQIDEVERRYRQRGLQPIFRLVSAMAPVGIDAALERRGFQYVDRSLVMSLPLGPDHAGELPALIDDPEEWLACYAEASGAAVSRQDVHLRMLREIKGRCAFAVERREGRAACVALAVLVEGRLGLFDVATSTQSRRQGLASGLCGKLLAWGLECGAHSAYLQVVAANTPAVRLYEGMGFREAYHYWYRVAD